MNKTVIIVAGNRRFNNYNFVAGALEALIADQKVTILTGGATGVDQLAHQWAGKKKLDRQVLNANWAAHNKAAGPIRNAEMVKMGTHLIAFHNGSRGTQDIINKARKKGIPVKIVKI